MTVRSLRDRRKQRQAIRTWSKPLPVLDELQQPDPRRRRKPPAHGDLNGLLRCQPRCRRDQMSLTMRFSEADLGDVTIAATPDVTWEVLLSLHVLQDNHGP